jgi:peptide/nickel transport system substrate-binding protein
MIAQATAPRFRCLAALLAAGVLCLAGCRREPASATQSRTAGPHRGGTVVTGWTSEPGGVNELIVPSSQPTNEMLFRVFLHLVEEQSDFDQHPPTLAPQLARSYDWSADHKILTFHLWDNADSKQWITDVEVVDPHTVRFHFSRVYFKQLLDANEGLILPKHAWEKLPFSQWRKSADWFKQHLVVDGPFTIASWQPGQQIVLQRNERYYEKGFPRLDRVVMRLIPSQSAGLNQLLNGELDFVPQIAPGDVPRVKANPQIQLIALWFNIYVAVGWNNENPLFRDPEVRRALTLGIDRQTIVDTLLGPYGRVADSPIVQMVWAHDDTIKPWPYDPAEARRILAAKGWKDTDGDGVLDKGGKPFAFELITNAGNQLRTDATVMIQDQLKKIGVQAMPRQVEFNTLLSQTNDGKFAAAILGFTMDTSLDMRSNFHSQSVGNGANYVRFRNPEMDRLIEQAASQPDVLAARPYLDQIQQLVHRQQPVTFLWESQRLTAVNKRVKDVRPTLAFSFFNLKEWWVEPKP